MRPIGIGVKPKPQIVAYSELLPTMPNSGSIGFFIRTTTGYATVLWWDGTEETISGELNWNPREGPYDIFGVDSLLSASKALAGNTAASKKIQAWSSTSTGKRSGDIVYVSTSKQGVLPICHSSRYTALDVSTLTGLKVLNCDNNRITSLGDIGACKNLVTLICSKNDIVTLNTSRNTNLLGLFCNHCDITSLTINPQLKRLGASSNPFTTFSLPNGSVIEEVYLNDSALTTLSLTNLSTLAVLGCRGEGTGGGATRGSNRRNIPALTTLDVSGCPNLQVVKTGSNLYGFTGGSSPLSSVRALGSGLAPTGTFPTTRESRIFHPTDGVWNFNSCSLTAGALNTLFSDLNTVIGGTIQISNNPGTSASNASIATAKSWTVVKTVS
jgi:hypothetical protein